MGFTCARISPVFRRHRSPRVSPYDQVATGGEAVGTATAEVRRDATPAARTQAAVPTAAMESVSAIAAAAVDAADVQPALPGPSAATVPPPATSTALATVPREHGAGEGSSGETRHRADSLREQSNLSQMTDPSLTQKADAFMARFLQTVGVRIRDLP